MGSFDRLKDEAIGSVIGTPVVLLVPDLDTFSLVCRGQAVVVHRVGRQAIMRGSNDTPPTHFDEDEPDPLLRAAIQQALRWLVPDPNDPTNN